MIGIDPEDRELPNRVLEIAAEQAGHGEAFTVAKLDRRLGAAGLEARNAQIVDDDRGGRVDRADLGRDFQVDHAVGQHRRREGQADTERLEFDRDGDRRCPPPPLPCATGIGNSPPARKLAVSPDSATSVGSASVVTAPLRSSAFKRRFDVEPDDAEHPRQDPEAVDDRAKRQRRRIGIDGLGDDAGDRVGDRCRRRSVALLKLAPLPNALMKPLSPLPLTKPLKPRSFSAPRLISEKRTSSITCCADPIDSRLMTLPGA